MLAGAKRCSVPGAFIVDIIHPRECHCEPVSVYAATNMYTRWGITVRYLPSWFPGVQFHRFAKKVEEDSHDARHLPLEHVADILKVGVLGMVALACWLISI